LELIILKLGGSVICDKSKPFSIRRRVLRRIANEISKFLKEEPEKKLIIIHGGGSFGHYAVQEYLSLKGILDLEALVNVERIMLELSTTLADYFIDAGIPISILTTHSLVMIDDERELIINTRYIEQFLRMGVVPMMYGDLIISSKGSIKVVSGDTLAWELAYRLKANKLLFATSVDGVYSSKPEFPNAILLNELSLSSMINKVTYSETSVYDVTGGMFRKLIEGIGKIRPSMKVYIFNGLRAGEIYRALKDRPLKGTVIKP